MDIHTYTYVYIYIYIHIHTINYDINNILGRTTNTNT